MLITTIEQFSEFVPTAVGIDSFDDLKPYVKSAETWLSLNVLGKDMYSFVSSSEAVDETLRLLCYNVVANHAYWDAIPFLDLIHTNQGFGVVKNNNLAPASRERVERLREQCLIRRDNEVESLIDYLEDNTQYHEKWKTSPAYSILSDCLITTARELALYAQWEGTRKDFLKLRPKLMQFSMSALEPVFSKDYVSMLVEHQKEDKLTNEDLRVAIMMKQILGCMVSANNEVAQKVTFDALHYMHENIEYFETYSLSREYAAFISANYENTLESSSFFSLH